MAFVIIHTNHPVRTIGAVTRPNTATMAWLQRVVKLKKKARGCHLVTDEVRTACHKEMMLTSVLLLLNTAVRCVHAQVLAMLPEVGNYQVGLAHFFCE